MSEDRNGLINFSELRRKTEEYNTISSKQSYSCAIDFDLDSNQQIIKSFKELREKLKTASKENTALKEEVRAFQVQLRQLRESESNLMGSNHQLKDRVSQLQQSNEEWKKRVALMKQQLSEGESLREEVKYLKQSLIDLKAKNENIEEERKKLIEISIQDKINLEEKVSKLQAMKQSDDHYLLQLENDLSKAKQTILKLQNSLKRLQIKYDEELFNKQWSKNNFEKEHYEKKITELEAEVAEVKSKNKREKEKRAELERRLLELQEMTGLCSVKAEVYEGQVEMMSKKVKKMERRVSQAKQAAHKMADEKVNWEQKFNKSALLCEQLINRVKREVMGDMVELAKTCEYKLNKLKEGREEVRSERLSSTKKYRSDKKSRNSVERQEQSNKKICLNSQTCRILFQSDQNKPKPQSAKSTVPPDDFDKQNESRGQLNCIQVRIRKQRDEMERKLKERLLYRKLQVSTSPSKPRLRQEYLRLVDK